MLFTRQAVDELKKAFISVKGGVIQGDLLPGLNDTYDLGASAMRFDNIYAASVIADSISGEFTGDHGDLTGLDDDDHSAVYADKTSTATISGAWTFTAPPAFNPTSSMAPFSIGANGQGMQVSGLNADELDGYDAADFPRKIENATIAGDWGITGDWNFPTAGFTIGTTPRLSRYDDTLFSVNVGFRSAAPYVYFSQTTGWRITQDGRADFRYIYADEMHVKAFIADISQALAGGEIVCKSVAIQSRDFEIPADTLTGTFYVEDLPGFPDYRVFAANDWIRLRVIDRSGGGLIVADVWGIVTNYTDLAGGEQSWTFTTQDDGGVSGDYTWAGGLALDYGQSGDGLWEVTTLADDSPFTQIQTWVTDPSDSGNFTTHVRIGNLDGITDDVMTPGGWGLWTDNVYLSGEAVFGAGTHWLSSTGMDIYSTAQDIIYFYRWWDNDADQSPHHISSDLVDMVDPTSVTRYLIAGTDSYYGNAIIELLVKSGKPEFIGGGTNMARIQVIASSTVGLINLNVHDEAVKISSWLGATIPARLEIGADLGAGTESLSLEGNLITAGDLLCSAGTEDIGSPGTPWDTLYVGTINADTITGSTLTGQEWEYSGDMVIDANTASTVTKVSVVNQATDGQADLDVERNIIVGGTVDGVDIAAHDIAVEAHHTAFVGLLDDADASIAPSGTYRIKMVGGSGLTTTAGTNLVTFAIGEGDLITVGANDVGLDKGSAQYQMIVTGSSPYTPVYQAISTLAGAGLGYATGILAVNVGDGLDISTDTVIVDVTDFIDTSYGLTESANDIRVNITTGLQFDAGAIELAWSGTPEAVEAGGSVAAGSSLYAAHTDHVHSTTTAAPATNLSVSSTNTDGSGVAFSRATHVHAITTSSAPSGASILACDANMYLQLDRLGLNVTPSYPIHIQETGTQIRTGYDIAGYLDIITIDGGTTTLSTATDDATGNLILLPAGDIVLDPTGLEVLPGAGYEVNLGSLTNKYLTLHAAELWVETLVPQDTVATIGGRVLVGPTTTYTADVSSATVESSFTVGNAGFETVGAGTPDVFADWVETIADGGDITQDATYYHGGSYSARIANGTAQTTYITQDIDVSPGGQSYYILRFWTRGSGSHNLHYGVYDNDNAGYLQAVGGTGVSGTSFEEVVIVIVPTLGSTTSIAIEFWCPSTSGGYGFVDDVTFVEGVDITVKHNQIGVGDIAYSESDSKVEFYEVIGGPYANGDEWDYVVERNKDGSGANDWTAGDALFNTGGVGNGWIDLYSIAGIDSVGVGPAIVGNVRNSITYNDWSEHWAIGNLNGVYGKSSDTYGVGFGKYAGTGSSYITITDAGGIQIYNAGNVIGQWDADGDVLIGQTGTNMGNVFVDASTGFMSIRLDEQDHIQMDPVNGVVMQDAANNAVGRWYLNGDFRLGKLGTDLPNMFYDFSAEQLQFRGGTNGTEVQAYVDTDGSIMAGGGAVKLAVSGIEVEISSAWASSRAFKLVNSSDVFIGGLGGYIDGGQGHAILQADPAVASTNAILDLKALSPSSSEYARIFLLATSGSYQAGIVIHADQSAVQEYVQILDDTAINGFLTVDDYVAASGGVHVGGVTDPGAGNLTVDGGVVIGASETPSTGVLKVKRGSDASSLWLYGASDTGTRLSFSAKDAETRGYIYTYDENHGSTPVYGTVHIGYSNTDQGVIISSVTAATTYLNVKAGEGGDAYIYLQADQHDDAGDGWRLKANASGQALLLGNDAAVKSTYANAQTWDTSGNSYFTGKVFINNNAGAIDVVDAEFSVLDGSKATLAELTGDTTDNAIAIVTSWSANTYQPGLVWVNYDDNAARPKAGLFPHFGTTTSQLSIGVSTGYGAAMTRFVTFDGSNGGIVTMRPSGDGVWDIGSGSESWDQGYAVNWNSGADFYWLDERVVDGKTQPVDDLAIICGIKPSDKYCERTGLRIIDDWSLPKWVFSVDKLKNEIVLNSEGKPYLSNRMTTSLTWGAIRQLAERVEDLEARLSKYEEV